MDTGSIVSVIWALMPLWVLVLAFFGIRWFMRKMDPFHGMSRRKHDTHGRHDPVMSDHLRTEAELRRADLFDHMPHNRPGPF